LAQILNSAPAARAAAQGHRRPPATPPA